MSGLPLLNNKLEKFLELLVICLLQLNAPPTLLYHMHIQTFYFVELLIIESWSNKGHNIVYLQLKDYDDEESYRSTVINILQDIMEIITQDVMNNGHE